MQILPYVSLLYYIGSGIKTVSHLPETAIKKLLITL